MTVKLLYRYGFVSADEGDPHCGFLAIAPKRDVDGVGTGDFSRQFKHLFLTEQGLAVDGEQRVAGLQAGEAKKGNRFGGLKRPALQLGFAGDGAQGESVGCAGGGKGGGRGLERCRGSHLCAGCGAFAGFESQDVEGAALRFEGGAGGAEGFEPPAGGCGAACGDQPLAAVFLFENGAAATVAGEDAAQQEGGG